jgi:hypothetical protein
LTPELKQRGLAMNLQKPLLLLGTAALTILGACNKKDAATSDTTAMNIDSTALRTDVIRDSAAIRDSIRLDSARRADSIRIVDTLGAKKGTTPP